jgi:hypothetical protein
LSYEQRQIGEPVLGCPSRSHVILSQSVKDRLRISKPAQSPHLLQNQFDFNTQSGWARSGGPGAASKQVDDQRDNGKNQQQVNHESGDVKEYESAGPKNHEQYR